MPRPLAVLLLAAALALAACQPVDRFTTGTPDESATPTNRPLGAPLRGMPASLDQLLERTADLAGEWQDETVLAELLVDLGHDGAWTQAEVTYLAPHADRLLLVSVDADGTRQERPTLATMALQPLTPAALEAVPAWPEAAREPADLVTAARDALRRCGTGRVIGALYATGAPVAWDGRRWTSPPTWSVTLVGQRGAVRVDPVSVEAGECVDGG